MGMKPHITLVNSIASAESPRINAFLNKNKDDASSFMHNTSLISIRKKLEHLPSGHILVCKVFYPGTKYINIEKGGDGNKRKKWNVLDSGLILPEYLVEFEYDFEEKAKKEIIVTLEDKNNANKEINRILAATIEAQKILQNTYLNPNLSDGVKGAGFHITPNDLDQ